ncbi:MAG: DUF4342 domain-containing protein [Clostridiales bacterium]|nr:DUF4342 domain-containing protein [Clostridiales bacterium]
MITLEQVEKLKERANVSYEDAKVALENSDGDMLDAVIYLEKQGKIRGPHMQAYNTQTGGVHGGHGHHGREAKGEDAYRYAYQDSNAYENRPRKGRVFRQQMGRLWRKLCALIRKTNANQFVILREGNTLINMPLTLLIIAAVFFFWVTIPLLVIGLFCDCRYRFQGPDFGKDTINTFMDQAAGTAEAIKRSVMTQEDAEADTESDEEDEAVEGEVILDENDAGENGINLQL